MTALQFAVAGDPKPQGNKTLGRNRATGRPVILEGRTAAQRAAFKTWRTSIDLAAHRARRSARLPTLRGPVAVDLLFVHHRPQSMRTRDRLAIRWRSQMPDVDKLARAVLDALKSASVIGDDAQVADLRARKVIAGPDERPGVIVTVTPLDHDTAPASVAHLLPNPEASP